MAELVVPALGGALTMRLDVWTVLTALAPLRSVLRLRVTLDHAAVAEALPWHHRDPFDRRRRRPVESATVISGDEPLRRYDVPIARQTSNPPDRSSFRIVA